MTALSTDPHQVELAARVVEMTGPNPENPAIVRAAFEAGVDAERAQAVAETTEEWGFNDGGGMTHGGMTIAAASRAA
jgi:hypothetical protein